MSLCTSDKILKKNNKKENDSLGIVFWSKSLIFNYTPKNWKITSLKHIFFSLIFTICCIPLDNNEPNQMELAHNELYPTHQTITVPDG